MSLQAPQLALVGEGETRQMQVSFDKILGATEVLTGTPTAVEITTTALTIASVAVSSGALVINGVSVAAGRAITFMVSGGVGPNVYKILLTCATDSVPAQTLEGMVRVKFLDDDA